MNQSKLRILSLDGGGIRGIVPATVLQYVEEKIIEKTKNPNARLADYFDLLVGTSTGGILACYCLIPNEENEAISSKYKAEDALKIYTEKGNEIFNQAKRSSWFGIRQVFNATRYSAGNLEAIFYSTFGDLKYHELLKPCVLTSYNMLNGKAVFFNTRERLGTKNRAFYVRDVVRSTSAAPTYFSPAEITNMATNEKMINLDGGVFANNPSMCAYAEARKTNFERLGLNCPKAKDMLLLSIGTGSMPIDLKREKKSRRWGIINWAKAVPKIMMDGDLDTVNYQMGMIFKSLGNKHQKNYKRVDVPEFLRFPKEGEKFNPPYDADMSNASAKNISALQRAGEQAIEYANKTKNNEYTLDDFIDKLIAQGKKE